MLSNDVKMKRTIERVGFGVRLCEIPSERSRAGLSFACIAPTNLSIPSKTCSRNCVHADGCPMPSATKAS